MEFRGSCWSYQEVRSHRTSVLRRDLLTTGQMDSGELVSPVIPRRVRRDYGLLSDPGGVQAVSQGNPPPGGHRTCSAGRNHAWEGLHHQQHWTQGVHQASSRSWLSAGGCRSPKLSGRALHSTCRSSLELPLLLLWTSAWPAERLERRTERWGSQTSSTPVVTGQESL